VHDLVLGVDEYGRGRERFQQLVVQLAPTVAARLRRLECPALRCRVLEGAASQRRPFTAIGLRVQGQCERAWPDGNRHAGPRR